MYITSAKSDENKCLFDINMLIMLCYKNAGSSIGTVYKLSLIAFRSLIIHEHRTKEIII